MQKITGLTREEAQDFIGNVDVLYLTFGPLERSVEILYALEDTGGKGSYDVKDLFIPDGRILCYFKAFRTVISKYLGEIAGGTTVLMRGEQIAVEDLVKKFDEGCDLVSALYGKFARAEEFSEAEVELVRDKISRNLQGVSKSIARNSVGENDKACSSCSKSLEAREIERRIKAEVEAEHRCLHNRDLKKEAHDGNTGLKTGGNLASCMRSFPPATRHSSVQLSLSDTTPSGNAGSSTKTPNNQVRHSGSNESKGRDVQDSCLRGGEMTLLVIAIWRVANRSLTAESGLPDVLRKCEGILRAYRDVAIGRMPAKSTQQLIIGAKTDLETTVETLVARANGNISIDKIKEEIHAEYKYLKKVARGGPLSWVFYLEMFLGSSVLVGGSIGGAFITQNSQSAKVIGYVALGVCLIALIAFLGVGFCLLKGTASYQKEAPKSDVVGAANKDISDYAITPVGCSYTIVYIGT